MILYSSIKQTYLRLKFGKKNKLGRNVRFTPNAKIGKGITFGDNVAIGENVTIKDSVTIDRDTTLRNATINSFSHIEGGVIFTGNKKGRISIGEHTYIGINNILDFSNDITIGNFVHIAGPSTGLWTHTSYLMAQNSIPLNNKDEKYRLTAPIIIEDNVYVGGNCTIYPGITIGHHSVIAPNSAVSKSIEPYTMVGGVPAKMIKSINPESTK